MTNIITDLGNGLTTITEPMKTHFCDTCMDHHGYFLCQKITSVYTFLLKLGVYFYTIFIM